MARHFCNESAKLKERDITFHKTALTSDTSCKFKGGPQATLTLPFLYFGNK